MTERTVLIKCLKTCGAILSKHYRKVDYTLKGKGNLVTKADMESETAAARIIRTAFPDHDILAEENHTKLTASKNLWIMDPLDGTTNYAHGYLAFCVSIALLKNGKPALGGIFDPFRNELFLAEKGKGATLNGKKIHVSKTARLKDSLVCTGFPYDRHLRPEFYCGFIADFLKICHDVRRSGSAALDMAWLSAGRIDGYWEFNLKPWDVAAGKLILEEAGGKVTDFSGNSWKSYPQYGAENLATNGKIHREMLHIIKTRIR